MGGMGKAVGDVRYEADDVFEPEKQKTWPRMHTDKSKEKGNQLCELTDREMICPLFPVPCLLSPDYP
jgi:hypothetical protein